MRARGGALCLRRMGASGTRPCRCCAPPGPRRWCWGRWPLVRRTSANGCAGCTGCRVQRRRGWIGRGWQAFRSKISEAVPNHSTTDTCGGLHRDVISDPCWITQEPSPENGFGTLLTRSGADVPRKDPCRTLLSGREWVSGENRVKNGYAQHDFLLLVPCDQVGHLTSFQE